MVALSFYGLFTEMDVLKTLLATLLKKTLAQLFSCEICVIFKNTIFTGHVWATASEIHMRSLE